MLDPLLTCHNNPLSEQVCLSRGVAVKINSYDMSLFPMTQHKEMYRSEINAGNTEFKRSAKSKRVSCYIGNDQTISESDEVGFLLFAIFPWELISYYY